MGVVAHQFAAAFRPFWETRSVPSPAQRLYQQNRVRHPSSQNINRCYFVGERGTLCCDHLKITGNAALVARDGKVQRALSGPHRFILDLRFVFQNSDRGQIILDLLESSEHVLSISSDLIVISGARLIVEGTSPSYIEDCTHGR